MRCDLCQGTGRAWTVTAPRRFGPCARCGGSGVDHCCGGETASDYDANEAQLAPRPTICDNQQDKLRGRQDRPHRPHKGTRIPRFDSGRLHHQRKRRAH